MSSPVFRPISRSPSKRSASLRARDPPPYTPRGVDASSASSDSSNWKQSLEKGYDDFNPWIRALLLIAVVVLGIVIIWKLSVWIRWWFFGCSTCSQHHHSPSKGVSYMTSSGSAHPPRGDHKTTKVALLSNKNCPYCKQAEEFLRQTLPQGEEIMVVYQGENSPEEQQILSKYDIQDDGGARPIIVNLKSGYRQHGYSHKMDHHKKQEIVKGCFQEN